MQRWKSFLLNRYAAMLGALLVVSAGAAGCEVISRVDRSNIPNGSAGGSGGSGGSGGAGGAGGSSGCVEPKDCPGTDTVCQARTCEGSACGISYAPSGTPTDMQASGDCKREVCDGQGGLTTEPDDADVLDDQNECTADTCDNGQPVNTPLGAGAACSAGEGKLCDGAGECVECLAAADCTSGVCDAAEHVCVPAACADGVKNGQETDQDCGGAECAGCADGLVCGVASDCQSGVCTGGACAAPTCADTVENGDETDVDCGGSACGPCGPGLGCTQDSDCVGNSCSGTLCLPTCTDVTKNQNETDVDCGGPECSPCADGQTCAVGGDCESGVCDGGTCAAPTCADTVKNGSETDVDCGGSACAPCGTGSVCGGPSDCASGVCTAGVCQEPSCADTVKNGTETDVDCGGGACPGCADGQICAAGTDCASSICAASVCVASLCGDGLVTGAETCDDANTAAGDGCSDACAVESGYACAGAPSVCAPVCGDGQILGAEACDDGNTTAGDGCNATCKAEAGFVCTGAPSVCATVCGDGIKVGAETCDDNNNVAGDGCNASCKVEKGYVCAGAPSICSTICGDGLVRGSETCDDANMLAGDGCSAMCTVEPGYACTDSPSVCGTVCGDGIKIGAEACDDKNTANNDCCSSACQVEAGCEIEPNDTSATANQWAAVSITNKVKGFNTPNTDKDVFAIVIPAGKTGTLKSETLNGFNGTTCASNKLDSYITIYNSAGTSLGTDDDSGDGFCSLLTLNNLGAGTYYVELKVSPLAAAGMTYEYILQNTLTLFTCGNGVIEGAEQCDDGNTVAGDGCSPVCKLETVPETEPNNTCAQATGPFALSPGKLTLASGSISPAGDADWFGFSVPAFADVRFETFDANGPGTCASIDTVIQVFRGDCTTALGASKDQGGIGSCSRLDPAVDTQVRRLAPGTYYAKVTAWSASATFNYTVQAALVSLCGDGKVEGYETCDGGANCDATCQRIPACGDGFLDAAEQCDDGNTVAGDSCSATCTWEAQAEVEPNNTTADADARALDAVPVLITGNKILTGAITPTADKDYYKVQVAQTSVVRFETFDATGKDCTNINTTLRLYSSAGTQLKTDAPDTTASGIGNCAALVVGMSAGTYYIQVERTSNSATIAQYFLQVRFENNAGSETEPNESAAQSNPLPGADTYIFGGHMTNADLDWFAITVGAGQSIRAETIEGGAKTCESNTADSYLTLFNAAGTSLVTDDDDGRGWCSAIDGTGATPRDAGASKLTPGTYYLRVSSNSSSTNGQFDYNLIVTIR